MFKHAIVRPPSREIIKGLTSVSRGKPDFEKALKQHHEYVDALIGCGLNVRILEADIRFPDSTFIEDIALCTPYCAVVTNPGAPSRKGETNGIRNILREYYEDIEEISSPGTLEAGDVMMAGNHFYIGLSARTNKEGAEQMIKILEKYGMSGSKVSVNKMLHLKSGISYLENNCILVSRDLMNNGEFRNFKQIPVDDKEKYSSNSPWINGKVFIPSGYPKTKEKIEMAGYETISLDVSEFRKVDGGLSCLSLRF